MSAAAITLISELIAVAEQIGGAYQRIRALSLQVGVTDAQLQEADARFAKIASDPLAGHTITPPPPAPAPDPSLARYATEDEAIAAAKANTGDNAYHLADGLRNLRVRLTAAIRQHSGVAVDPSQMYYD